MKKKYLLIALLLMAVGFAAVSTTLVINGTSILKKNTDDFKVYYSDALVNGTQDLSVVVDDTHLSFKTTLDTLGQTYVLDYDVTNSSKNYDAKLTMNCTGGNEYLTVVNTFNTTDNLLATETRRGKLTLTLAKSYTGNDLDVEIECTIDADAVERTTLGDKLTIENQFCVDLGYDYGYYYPQTYKIVDVDVDNESYVCAYNDEENFYIYSADGELLTREIYEPNAFCIREGYDSGFDLGDSYKIVSGGGASADRDPSIACVNNDEPDVYYGYYIDGDYAYEIPVPKIITFTIDGVEYESEEGWDWETWIYSGYNTIGVDICDCGAVAGATGHISYVSTRVEVGAGDLIEAGGAYKIATIFHCQPEDPI